MSTAIRCSSRIVAHSTGRRNWDELHTGSQKVLASVDIANMIMALHRRSNRSLKQARGLDRGRQQVAVAHSGSSSNDGPRIRQQSVGGGRVGG
jgi:hypothetical protein